MDYAIVKVAEAAIPSRKWKYSPIERLAVGEAFRVPYSDMSYNRDPRNTVRTVASYYGKKMGRRYRTRSDAMGVWIIREA